MSKKILWLLAIIVVAVAAIVFVFRGQNQENNVVVVEEEEYVTERIGDGSTVLSYAVHWTEDFQLNGIYEGGQLIEKGLRQYLEEYVEVNPDIAFDIMIVPYVEYESKLQLLHDIDEVPDIFQAYSPWGATYLEKNMIAMPPQDIKDDVENNYISKAGAYMEGDIWGIPSEINDFSLIYNKKIFKDAGIVDQNGEALAPVTWTDLVDAASRTTKWDEAGNITTYGFAFTKGMDWAVVDPFLSLLLSNGGAYLNEDNTRAVFNSGEGIEVLSEIVSLFDNSYTDTNSNVWDFSDGKVAMAFIAPWTEGVFKEGMAERFDEEVGVAPIPYFQEPGTLQYNWFLGVMEKSNNKNEAWDFLRWFTTEIQAERGTTRYGDLMARTIKAIPSRLVDMENNADVLEDNDFKAPFIAQLEISTPEPNIPQAAAIKQVLMQEIEAAWIGKDPADALNDAAYQVNSLLRN